MRVIEVHKCWTKGLLDVRTSHVCSAVATKRRHKSERPLMLLLEVEVNLPQTVSRTVFLGAGNPSGIRDQFFLSP
jgi:hypothetical protein